VDYQDILYEERDGSARIAINRPDVMNAFRGQTVEELLHALGRADDELAELAFLVGARAPGEPLGGVQPNASRSGASSATFTLNW